MIQNFLANLLATFTGPRYFPDFEWSSKLWTHNIFRFFGMFFGEHYGIRPSITSWRDKTEVQQIAYTLEAQIALFEVYIRSFLKKLSPKLVLIPQLQLAGYSQEGILPYRFAIAWDATSASGTNTNTQSHTCTGSNGLLVAYVVGDINATDNLTGVTYNSVAMTFGCNLRYSTTDRWNDIYVLGNPATGANNIVTAGNTFNNIGAISYTGCNATGQPDSSATFFQSTALATASLATTVVAANCWLVGSIYAPGGYASSGGSVIRANGTIGGAAMLDSGATVGTGSQSLAATVTSNPFVIMVISIKPVSAVTPKSGFFFKAVS